MYQKLHNKNHTKQIEAGLEEKWNSTYYDILIAKYECRMNLAMARNELGDYIIAENGFLLIIQEINQYQESVYSDNSLITVLANLSYFNCQSL